MKLVAGALVGAVLLLGTAYGFVRAILGVSMFVGILLFGWSYWRNIGLAPPEPELADVSEYGLKYVCTMCGLELKVEVAAKDRAPRHCTEEMELIRTGGRPPLRPI
ncbi:MAG: hypothetical protein H0W55_07050 [Actinobacteria bacterium]|jgi:hypothetical protein|nr:hypothetical protein [Actinomycetota bacterium]MDQ3531609.1 hypothetical protein [Actinomycetota bacterium]